MTDVIHMQHSAGPRSESSAPYAQDPFPPRVIPNPEQPATQPMTHPEEIPEPTPYYPAPEHPHPQAIPDPSPEPFPNIISMGESADSL